ncbi:MAG: TolC family protein [Candidatus Omnitrophica bacterium]|nr:TolC family protein [Candidatus Omnitrophota bacterium]MCM8802328.1 TolC family protein [Candidatus Omnitrophota bacterium]
MRIKTFIILFCILFTSCSLKNYEKQVDKEVHEIIKAKTEKVKETKIPVKISEDIQKETYILTLKSALILSAEKNRDYQVAKENVYLSVLDLTYQRYLFQPRVTFSGNINWSKNSDEKISSNLNLNLIKTLSTAGQISLNIGEAILKYLTGDKEEAFQSILSLNLFQPLFKGAGRKIALENLIQSERNVVYQIRDFLRYQKSFSIDITKDYLNLLLYKKRMENYYANYINLKTTRERIEMLSEAGRIAPFQVDQARQNEYNAYQRWIDAQNLYFSSLDSFKIKLGFSPSFNLVLEDKEIETLFEKPLPEIKLDITKYIDYALQNRLDLITEYEKVEDSQRKVEIALNNLKNEIDLNVSIKSTGDVKANPNIDLNKPEYDVGIDFNIPFSKLPQRNEYKRALIQYERTKRNFDKKIDIVKKEIIDSYRNLQESYQSYNIQLTSLKLAEKRVESTDLLLQAGRATIRDLLEAQEAYLAAKNNVINSIASFILEYLNFLYITEKLELDEKGIWKGDINEILQNI